LTSIKASGKAFTSSGYSISSPFRTEYSISISRKFINKSIKIKFSTFIIKLLDTNNYITTEKLYK
jgi:hypothetical protein